MKDAKFNPIPGNSETAIGYNPEAVAAMSRKDFGNSVLAQQLAYGQTVPDEMRNAWLDAWHGDATRLVEAAKPAPDATATKQAEKK